MLKKTTIYLFFILAICLAAGNVSPARAIGDDPYSPIPYGMPETITGRRVLAVLSSENTACMELGTKQVVIETNQRDGDDFLKNIDANAIIKVLSKHDPTTKRWELTLVGFGTSRTGFLAENEKSNTQMKKFGCQKSRHPMGVNNLEPKPASGVYGYAIIQNTDADGFTDDNAQSVFLVAPLMLGNNQGLNNHVAILNNVRTNLTTKVYVLQNGLHFENGIGGKLVWTDTDQGISQGGYVTRYYAIPYVAGHTYSFVITYTNSYWWMCAKDATLNTKQECHYEPNQNIGTTLRYDDNTSIYVENKNGINNPTWYQGFSPSFRAGGARIYRKGIGQFWSYEVQRTAACPKPAFTTFGGTLMNGQGASFFLKGVPFAC